MPEPLPGASAIDVIVVIAPVCHLCEDAQQALAGLAAQHPLQVRLVELESPEGMRLTARHRPAMSPLVLIDGTFFSAGRLPRKKFAALLAARAASSALAAATTPAIAG
ncbi:MAG: glutaredoxin [Cellulomonas sp.]